jgi:hypothetical protein
MLSLKQVALSAAAIAVSTSVTVLYSTPTQAAIVGGKVSGVWSYDYDGTGGFNVGDAFTAEYTYDSDSITETDYSYSGYYNAFQRTASLLSLVLKSGSFSHIFDLDPSANKGSGIIQWYGFKSTSSSYGQADHEQPLISAYESSASGSTSLYAYLTSGVDFFGNPFSSGYASAYSSDYNTGEYFSAYGYNNIEFSGATPDPASIPTPALLPGLIGLGVSVLRRRKQADASPAEQQA